MLTTKHSLTTSYGAARKVNSDTLIFVIGTNVEGLAMIIKKKERKKNTDAPMCRLCETRHWSNQPHHFEPKSKKA